MSTCVEKLPHSCGGTRSLQVFLRDDGEYDGYCFRCGTYEKHPYGEGQAPPTRTMTIKTPDEIAAEIKEITEMVAHEIPERKLSRRALEYFGVRVGLSEFDGVTPVSRFYPYYTKTELKGYKCKTNTKQMFSVGSTRGCDMFGWQQAMRYGDKYTLFITEGEDDAIALFSVLKRKWNGSGNPSVISLRSGCKGATRDVDHHIKDIQRMFKKVVLVFDNDDPGRSAVQAVSKLLPGVHVATLPLKDANDMVIAGRDDELFKAVMYETAAKISAMSYRSSEIWHLATEVVQEGLPWPWPEMTEVTRGRRRKEVYYFGAGVKMGSVQPM
jgi:hypothetical protein